MSELSKKTQLPSVSQTAFLTIEELKQQLDRLEKGWNVIEGKRIKKTFSFKDFKEALSFVEEVGKTAETQTHYPAIYLFQEKVTVTFWTHKIDALSVLDFSMAAKCDVLYTARVG